ncbi:MAG TPA: sulfotransferase [Kiritimatiellia bacterium]|nr:sulfotransferase [Kiritimatiellia bacterium]
MQQEVKDSLLPNVIIAGFPKCGTSGLLFNLGRHPDVHHHQLEADFFGNPDRTLEEYSALFLPGIKYNVEKTPLYVLRHAAMQHMADLIPHATIILCIRHPIQAIHSFYNFRVFEHQRHIPKGIDPGKFHFEDIILNDLEVHEFSAHHYCYMKHIRENVLPHYPREQLYFVVQERMVQNKRVEMNKLFQHLGLPDYDGEFINRAKLHGEGFRYGNIDYKASQYRDALEKLRSMFTESNRELCAFLQDDLPEWDYFDRMYAD